MPRTKSDSEFKEHFLNCCEVDPVTQCWNWTLGKSEKGYGRVKHGGVRYRAHRMSYQLFVGEIPDDMYVLHHCDNPSCINPDHLFVGTNVDNIKDMINKNRQWSKLTSFEVRCIKECKCLPASHVAKLFGVSSDTIRDIYNDETWKHI